MPFFFSKKSSLLMFNFVQKKPKDINTNTLPLVMADLTASSTVPRSTKDRQLAAPTDGLGAQLGMLIQGNYK